MLKFSIPVERGNEAAKDGTLGRAIETLIEQVQPEAAYFTVDDGKRTGLIFFNEADQARLPAINEPLFAALEAEIDILPALTLNDLRRGLTDVSGNSSEFSAEELEKVAGGAGATNLEE